MTTSTSFFICFFPFVPLKKITSITMSRNLLNKWQKGTSGDQQLVQHCGRKKQSIKSSISMAGTCPNFQLQVA